MALAIKLLTSLFILVQSSSAYSHGGGLDSNGGHNNRKTGCYHCHREPCLSRQRESQRAEKIYQTPAVVQPSIKNTNSASECNGHLKLGIPGGSDQLLCRMGYAIGYDYEKKSAVWVAYRLTHQIHSSGNVSRQDNFRADLELPGNHRKTLADFEEPVFDRGHLVSSASLDATIQMNSEIFL